MPRAAKAAKSTPTPNRSAANVGYEAQLWEMADALRGSMDAAGYKHVALGLIAKVESKDGRRRRPRRVPPDIAQQVGQPLQEARIPPLQ